MNLFEEVTRKIRNEMETKYKAIFPCEVEEVDDDQVQINSLLINILSVELMVKGFINNYGESKASIENVWSILPNFKEILPDPNDVCTLEVLRILFKESFTLTAWRLAVKEYCQQDARLRCYDIIDNHFIVNRLTRFKSFYSDYDGILSKDSVQRKEKKLPPFVTEEVNKDVFIQRFSNKGKNRSVKELFIRRITLGKEERGFPAHLLKSSKELEQASKLLEIPSGRLKINRTLLDLKLNEKPWADQASLMNNEMRKNARHINGKLRNWEEAQNSFIIRSLNQCDSILRYQDNMSVAGMVGAGKSTMLNLELFRLKELGAKSAVLTVNVVDSLLLVFRLRLVGIKAAPIIGRGNLEKHITTFLKQVKNEAAREDENQLSKLANSFVFEFFEGSCDAQILIGSEQLNPPCISLQKRNENQDRNTQLTCPLFMECGKYTIERQLRDADVWVGTESAFIHTSPLPIVNPRGLTYKELAYEEMDVIFVDEADSIQEAADGSFKVENKLFGDEDATFESTMLSISHQLEQRYDLSDNRYATLWIHYSTEARKAVHFIYQIIKGSEWIRKNIRNKTFGTNFFIRLLTKNYFSVRESDNEIVNHPLYEILDSIDLSRLYNDKDGLPSMLESDIQNYMLKLNQLQMSQDLNPLLKEQEATKDIVVKIFDQLGNQETIKANLSVNEETNGLIGFKFFICLLYFDCHYKLLINLKAVVQQSLSIKIDEINTSYKIIKRYLPFLPEAPTGRSFQYHYKEYGQKRGNIGTFMTYNYYAIGRKVLTNFSRIFESVSDKQGPCMMYLSGTSFSEGSDRYHLDIKMDYLLEPTAKIPLIQQKLLPTFNNGKPIFISGVKDELEKLSNLKKMAKEIIPWINEQLSYWKDANRKVLLVVNSYDQCIVVKSAISGRINGEIKMLSNETFSNEEEITRGEVEFFADTEADVLIVPLLSINRAYNILKPDGESLFGSVFFMIRPYLPPGDVDNAIKIVNGAALAFAKEAGASGKMFYEGIKYVRQQANMLFEGILSDDPVFKTNEKVVTKLRNNVAWLMFIHIWQMIGRLLRGQTNANVFYVDAAFAKQHALGTGKAEDPEDSMLMQWVNILEKSSSNDMVKQKLFGEFLRGLKEALSIVEKEHKNVRV
jgi:hypothetical protein